MLRLGAGWSAEHLSRQYGAVGAGDLPRTTIAKIEGGVRQIKAGETDGVARVFGLQSADLLGAGRPAVYLSYAEQDEGDARTVSAWLSDRGFAVSPAGRPAMDGEQGSGASQAGAIGAAEAFIAFLTPGYLTSPKCREEQDLASRRQRELISEGQPGSFIYVVRRADSADLDDPGLSSYPLVDLPMPGERSRETALSKLGASIITGARAPDRSAGRPVQDRASAESLSRGPELESVLQVLASQSGVHAWLVVSPPGFGKSWFLAQLQARATEQLAARTAEQPAGNWAVRMVDLRGPDRVIGREPDAMTIIRQLFGVEQEQPSDPADDLRDIALKVIGAQRSCLCLLDSAELLSADTVGELRRHFRDVYRLIQDAGAAGLRLAMVAASRRSDGWGGIAPAPLPSILPLTAFGPTAIQAALEELARTMSKVHSPAKLRQDAGLLHRFTEGLPVLVQEGTRWIDAQQWLGIDRLSDQRLFDQIVAPYIDQWFLSKDSLRPAASGQLAAPVKEMDALRGALRALVPYRFFTTAHVQRCLDEDGAFRADLMRAGWSADQLWDAIGDTALLLRPLVEPWQELHPVVRRLLFRYFYGSDDPVDAHRRARNFTVDWARQLTGKDQIIAMVEAIWHEATRLRLSEETEMEAKLSNFARSLSRDIRPSVNANAALQPAYTKAVLRDYAVQRMEADLELQRDLSEVDGLFGKLTQVMRAPDGQED